MRQGIHRQALHAATRPIHARLDDSVGELSDLSAYRAYLVSTTRFRAGVEAALGTAAWPDDWTWRPVMVAPQLRADGADLGIGPVAQPARLAPPADTSALLGMLYVVEGASLGAKILRRRAARLGLRDDFGARHLAVMAEGAGWRGFMPLLEESAEFDLERAIGAASATFAAALDCFEGERRVAA